MATGVRIELITANQFLKNTSPKWNAGIAAATLEAHGYITKHIKRTQPTTKTASGKLVGLNPSKPGEYPKVVSRRLIQGLNFKMKKDFGFLNKGEVYTKVKYARALEYGGRSFLRRGAKEGIHMIGWAFLRGAKGVK